MPKRVTITLKDESYKRIKATATANHRSLAGEIQYAVDYYLRKEIPYPGWEQAEPKAKTESPGKKVDG